MKLRSCSWLVLLTALLASAPLFAAGWTSVSTLQSTWLASGPSNSMFAADAGAFYGSTTAGKSWQAMTGPGNSPYSALTYFDATVWMGTTQKGAAYSKTLGTSWSTSNSGMLPPFPPGVPAKPINALVSQPGVPSKLVAGTSSGVYLSTDGGGSWAETAKGLPIIPGALPIIQPVLSLASISGGTILAGTGAGVYRSIDGGANWTASGLASGKVSKLSALWSAAYAIVDGVGLYVSSDSGNSWTLASLPGATPNAVLAHPEQPGVVFVGSTAGSVYQSDDYGASWYEISDGSFTAASVSALAVPNAQPDALVVATNAGMFRYESLVIPAVTRAPLDTSITSSAVTVSGLLRPASIAVSGGMYSINGRAFTSTPGFVVNGSILRVQVRSSSAYSTRTTATVTIGTVPARFLVTTLPPSSVSSLTQVFVSPPAGAQLVNGVVLLSSTTPVPLQPNPPSGSVIQTSPGTPLSIGTLTITDMTGGRSAAFSDATGSSLTFVSSGSGTVPQVVSGIYAVESGAPGNKLAVGSGGVLSTVSTQTSMVINRNAAVTSAYVSSGTASITYANTFADTATIYNGETAEVGVEGSLTRIRLGSLNGDQNLPGDPLTLIDVTLDSNVPNLNGNLARLNNSASLLTLIQTALNARFGVTTGRVRYDANQGVVVYTVNAYVHRFIPIGSPTVQLGGTVAAASNRFSATSPGSQIGGVFDVASQGIQLTLASSLGYFTDLNQAIKTMDPNAKVRIRSSGVLQLTIGGGDYVGIPGSIGAGGGAAPSVTPGFQLDNNGLISFMDSYGAMQVLYPIFADTSVVDLTVKAIDPSGSVSDNGNGTGTMILLGSSFTTRPEYQLIPLPAGHEADLWWMDGARLFVRYPDATAQAFGL